MSGVRKDQSFPATRERPAKLSGITAPSSFDSCNMPNAHSKRIGRVKKEGSAMSEKGPREDVVVTEERDKKGEKKLGGLAELENTASGRTRRLLAWIGGGVAAIIATTATAYVTGLLNLILPGPDEAICNFV